MKQNLHGRQSRQISTLQQRHNFTNTIPPEWISDQASRTQVVCPTLLYKLLVLPYFQTILNILLVFSFNGIVSRQILYLAEGDQLGLATDILTVNGVYDITLCIRPL